jgi:hypothetical protein
MSSRISPPWPSLPSAPCSRTPPLPHPSACAALWLCSSGPSTPPAPGVCLSPSTRSVKTSSCGILLSSKLKWTPGFSIPASRFPCSRPRQTPLKPQRQPPALSENQGKRVSPNCVGYSGASLRCWHYPLYAAARACRAGGIGGRVPVAQRRRAAEPMSACGAAVG